MGQEFHLGRQSLEHPFMLNLLRQVATWTRPQGVIPWLANSVLSHAKNLNNGLFAPSNVSSFAGLEPKTPIRFSEKTGQHSSFNPLEDSKLPICQTLPGPGIWNNKKPTTLITFSHSLIFFPFIQPCLFLDLFQISHILPKLWRLGHDIMLTQMSLWCDLQTKQFHKHLSLVATLKLS